MTVIKKDTVLNAQQKGAHFEKMTKGQTENFVARFTALHNDVRSYAIPTPDGDCAVPASVDMLNAVTGHKSYGLTKEASAQIDAMGLNVSRMYRHDSTTGKGANMKAIKRFHQMLNSLSNAAAPHMGIDTVSTIILLSLIEAGDYPLAHDAIFYMGAGKQKKEGVSANTRGVNRTRVINQILGFAKINNIDSGTMRSQMSRSIGIDGFLSNIGAVENIKTGSGKEDYVFKLNHKNPLVIRFKSIYENLTDGQLQDFADEMKLTK